MTGDEGREVCETMVPQAEIDRLCQPCGVLERQRQLNLGMLVRAMVISAGTPGGASQADVLRSSLACEVPPVARSAFDQWFDEPRERFMEALTERAQAYARAPTVDRSGPRCGVTDWDIGDAPTVTVRDALREACPGTGHDAAITGQKVLSVGCGAPGRYPCSPAREHDRRPLQIAESGRGYGRLADLAYARLDRLQAGEPHGVRYVMRLQDNWKPKVDSLARGQVPAAFFPGTDLDALLEDDTLGLDGRAIAAEVQVGTGKARVPVRLVGVHTPKGDGFFLTNLPPRSGPQPVADLSRVRWEGELSSRLDTSVNRLDAIDAEPPCTLKTLVHASRIASTVAAILAQTPKVHTRPQQPGAPRTEAPLHSRRLALQLAVSCQSMAQAFERTGAEATHRWHKIAAWLTHRGQDPNWRRRPSVLDQLRGWKRQPLTRKKPTSGDVRHGHVKTAA